MRLGRDLRLARNLSLRTCADLAIAVAELALARIRLAVQDTDKLIGRGATSAGVAAISKKNPDPIIDRVAFAIPRMGARVPWLATCLVQALAAQHWLRRRGIRSLIIIGARKSLDDVFDAHAWLEAEGRVVVGGEAADYAHFASPRTD